MPLCPALVARNLAKVNIPESACVKIWPLFYKQPPFFSFFFDSKFGNKYHTNPNWVKLNQVWAPKFSLQFCVQAIHNDCCKHSSDCWHFLTRFSSASLLAIVLRLSACQKSVYCLRQAYAVYFKLVNAKCKSSLLM